MTRSALGAADGPPGSGGRLARARLPKKGTGFAQALNCYCNGLPVLRSGRGNPPHGFLQMVRWGQSSLGSMIVMTRVVTSGSAGSSDPHSSEWS